MKKIMVVMATSLLLGNAGSALADTGYALGWHGYYGYHYDGAQDSNEFKWDSGSGA